MLLLLSITKAQIYKKVLPLLRVWVFLLEYKRNNLDKVTKAMLGHNQGWTMVYWYGAEEGWDQGADHEEEAQPYYRQSTLQISLE